MAYLLVIVVYSLAQIALGVWIARRARGSGEFFVAGRSLGPGLIAATLLAANIGAGSTIGAAGRGYRDGIPAWWWVGSAAIGSAILAIWIAPRIRRIAAEHDLKTIGDYLEWRYDHRVRAAIAALLWVATLAILAGQYLAVASILGAVVGLGKATSCLIGAIVATSYFVAGGLRASVTVNVVQVSVKLLGFAVALPLALASVGGISGLHASFPPGPYWSLWSGGHSGWFYMAIVVPAFIVSPGILQKVYAARDDRAARVGVGVNAIVLLLFALIPPVLGMIARARHPELGPAGLSDQALPMVFKSDIPFWAGALGLAAVFSADLSAADAVLFMLATSFSQDLYKRFVNPSASEAQVLRVARAAAVAGSVLAVLIAVALAQDVVDSLSIFYTLLGVSLFVPMIAGLFTRRRDPVAALCAIAGGVAVAAGLQRFSGPGFLYGLTPPMWGIALAAVAYTLATVLIPRRTP